MRNSESIYIRKVKTIFDILFAVIGLCITFPIIFIFSVLIMLESPGPPFYLQERLGFKGKKFNIVKLRSMRFDAEKNGAQWAKKNDPRITKVGMFIRMTRIDELPQFFNILKGDMSVVGPRPERPIFTKEFEKQIPGFKKRLLVKPGVTGWAQVNGGYDITPREKLELDIYYINNVNCILDIKIMLNTIKVVFTGDGAR
ncbi:MULTISPECIES: sugar transferase [Bacillus cereus group]|uniref:sugar transferase n=1 Tax=Bacillus cereus group TaxID=86661 RepID=UPI001EF465CF|nr:exopolysaccharide biosynthesis polyprenyl glycosylphosphotransferase [Bacillus cereus]